MFLAHLGVALLIIGITGSSVWQKELITRLNINDEIIFNENRIILKDIDKISNINLNPSYLKSFIIKRKEPLDKIEFIKKYKSKFKEIYKNYYLNIQLQVI